MMWSGEQALPAGIAESKASPPQWGGGPLAVVGCSFRREVIDIAIGEMGGRRNAAPTG